jgi:hypothetical protein
MRHYGAEEGNYYYLLNNKPNGKLRKGLGFGGNSDK